MARTTLDYSDDHPTGPKRDNPFTSSSEVDLKEDSGAGPVDIDAEKGIIKIERPDGSVTIDFGGNEDASSERPLTGGFDRNLAEEMDDMELSAIVADLIEGIEADIQSRKEWMEIRSKGIKMLALKIEEPSQGEDFGPTSAPVEGQSRIRHSLMLEATVAFQAGARGELLPASGPVKVKNVGPGASPTQAPDSQQPLDELANALEMDLNWYLTDTAKEYVPDTDRMLFHVAYGGDGFKKLFHCPLRRRPVSESVEAEDLIVSNAATDISNCGRVTHRIRMRRATLRRMQLTGAYRDIDLPMYADQTQKTDSVKQEKAEIAGQKPEPIRAQDKDYELYECYTELDIDRYAPRQLRDEGLPLPYIVTIETASRKCLALRRNWRKKDRECMAKQRFVQYPFIRGIGFYGLGFVHLLGNAVMALTAAYRVMLDNGMFANFPGFIYDKSLNRQNTNQFRIPPGGGKGIDIPQGKKIQDVIMPVPYKETGPAFPAFIQHVEDRTKQIAMVANASVGEGKQDAPVGTTLALLEQATKVESSAFKRLHDAQAEEFRIIKELFREDPEALWRHAKGSNPSGYQWQRAQFLAALEKYELIPVADPNNPTALHRLAKATLLKMLAMQNPQAYDMIAVDKRIMQMANIDSNGVFKPPQPPGIDPVMLALQMRMQMAQLQAQARQQEQQLKAALAIQQEQGKAADRASRERIEQMKMQLEQTMEKEKQVLERMKLNQDAIIHVHGLMQAEHEQRQTGLGADRDHGLAAEDQQHRHGMERQQHGMERQQFEHQRGQDQAGQRREDEGAAHQRGMDFFKANQEMVNSINLANQPKKPSGKKSNG